MSNTDSFIEEVTEEVRRDRLFGLIRRYGWIAVLAVVAIVGAAAANEVRKNNALKAAQNTGDALISAVATSEAAARVEALSDLKTDSENAQVVADMLLATHQVEIGEGSEASNTLQGIVTDTYDMPDIYRQIAAFKAVLAQGSETPASERRLALETLAAPGMPLSLLAREQLALLTLEEGDAESAVAQLQELLQDAGVTAGLRQRASQLIVALGETPTDAIGTVAGQ
ncbi:DUF2659 family protein [Shimia marina]|uniref:Tetratricopeptide repeat-like domain-containing protein n=1 Tax=Shimia marina TaxID=321267 RepID=A0A0P1EUL3_9RHOB|nr:hypothetical protein [Shimia marina]CUH53797.1 hypothetical protein SHM7688_03259 [Shimia marina]SFE77228.1 hypothetical protein SAMN04488037_12033 [Shimia marina]